MAPHAVFASAGYPADLPYPVLGAPCGSPTGDFATSKDGGLIEAVAIVGLSFRFPQEACSTDSFWKMLMEQRSTATEFPKDRLSASALYHPDPNRRGTVNSLSPRPRFSMYPLC